MGKYGNINDRAKNAETSSIKRLPEGEYPLRFLDVEMTHSKKGNPMIVIKTQVYDRNSQFHGAKVNLRYFPTTEHSMDNLFMMLQRMGCDLSPLNVEGNEDQALWAILGNVVDSAPTVTFKATPQKDSEQYNNWNVVKEKIPNLFATQAAVEASTRSAPSSQPSTAAVASSPQAAPSAAPTRPNPFA